MPGNDDASRAITLYCDLVAKAAIDGISRAQGEQASTSARMVEPEVVEEVPAETDRLGFAPLSGPRGVADDLKKFPGVSPAIEKKLNDLGIFHCLADRRTRRPSPPTISAKRSGFPAASRPGSRGRRNRWRPKPSDGSSFRGAADAASLESTIAELNYGFGLFGSINVA